MTLRSTGAWQQGWWLGAARRHSPNFGPRPAGAAVELVVVHSISLPPGVYGGDAIERLFANRLDPAGHPYFEQLRGLQVSAHLLVRRDGQVLQFVSCDDRAWHAGASCWAGRDNCNDWSVGVELEGVEGETFEAAQYEALARILRALARRYPVAQVVGHEHIAPGRKGDPGAAFDWGGLRRRLRWPARMFPPR
jgi:N-acetyl-anhydromuramoyl-L-alanine amidase